MSSMTDMISQVADLSLADKLSLIDSITASIRKEGGMPAKKVKVSKVTDGTPKPKRKAALGTLAWTAYVKHCKTTMPESFEGLTKESEKLVVVKGIRAEDPEGYKTFTDEWKAEHAEVSDASEAESVADTASVAEPVAAPVKKVVKAAPKAVPEPKIAKVVPKAAAAAKPAAAAAAAPKPAAAAAAAPKVAPKVAVKKAVKKVEEAPSMPQKEIDGTLYWHDPESNGLWEVTGETVVDGTGSWIGYYQPGNEEEPIRFTEAYGSD